MARNIVPRTDKGADLGTLIKKWNNVHTVNLISNNVYTDKLVSDEVTLDGSDLKMLLDKKTDLDILIAKGDLYVAMANGIVTRLPRGNDGEVLRSNSLTPEGLEWAPGSQRTSLDGDLTVTVGPSGNFLTINEALESVTALYYPKYISGNNCPKVTIKLLSGFVMAEQVLVEGLDLSWITITGYDTETTIIRSALTKYIPHGYPAFGVIRGTLPTISQLFNMDTSGNADSRHGVLALDNAKATISSGCGVKNAAEHGIFAVHGSSISAYSANASGAGGNGIYAAHGSSIDAVAANASGAGGNGIYALQGSSINAAYANASEAGGHGIHASHGASINAYSANASEAGGNGIYAIYGSSINAVGANASGAGGSGIYAIYGSSVDAAYANASEAVGNGIHISFGSIVNAHNAIGTLNQVANNLTANGIIFQ